MPFSINLPGQRYIRRLIFELKGTPMSCIVPTISTLIARQMIQATNVGYLTDMINKLAKIKLDPKNVPVILEFLSFFPEDLP